MTQPLREMTAAARAMARGDYSRRVRATSRDEVGELAQAFNLMSADLAAADQHRRELIANVSHELRTPITALQAVLENIVDGVAEPDPTTLRTALAQTERLGRLVTELLDLSRIDAGAHRLELAAFAVAPFVDEVVAEARVVAAGAGREVHFGQSVQPGRAHGRRRPGTAQAGGAEPARQRGPPLAGRRRGPARRRASRRRPGARGAATRARASRPAERERVFERFTRGERATGGGTGLGLAIARWVVSLHGGSIAVVDPTASPRPRSGCRMRVVLPAVST